MLYVLVTARISSLLIIPSQQNQFVSRKIPIKLLGPSIISATADVMSTEPNQPTSFTSGTSEQAVVPRDVRLLHLIFAVQGIQNYQDHVPLQLMDFAFRYTTNILKDARIYNDHAHTTGAHISNAGNSGSNALLTTDDVRLAIAARTNYQFKPSPPKELLLELAAERNKKPLPPVMPSWGIRLPPEKYCLTAKDWNLSDEEDEEMKDAK